MSQATVSHPSSSRPPQIPSRPTTPLRPPSRTSLRASQTTPGSNQKTFSTNDHDDPLLLLEPAFAELSDSMADLEANFLHLQLLNDSLGRFNENFAAFLYGMNMTAFCVDFPEAPISQSFTRSHDPTGPDYTDPHFRNTTKPTTTTATHHGEIDATFLTSDTSFVENPPPTTSSKGRNFGGPAATAAGTTTPKRRGAAGLAGRGTSRGGGGANLGRTTSTRQPASAASRGASTTSGIARGARGGAGGIPRAGMSSTRGTRGTVAGGSGIARGISRGTTR